MKAPAKAWWAGALAVLPFLIAASLITWLRDLPGALPWVLWVTMVVLGLAAGVLVFLFVKRRAPATTAPAGLVKRIDESFADAGRRLKRAKRPKIGASKALVLMGPAGSTKTSLIERSELGVDLLVGEVNRGEEIIPTAVANIWAGGDSIIIEAGPEVVDDEASWKRLVRRLRPKRWAPTLGRGALPPRAAIVCVPIHEFLTPDAMEYGRHTAAALRDRLAQLAGGLGIELPTYVVFTKVDRIPYFADFVASLDDREAQQVVGATLPFQVEMESEAYGEQQTQRVRDALAHLHRTLAMSRIDLLPREAEGIARLGAYEFPRELNKVRDRLTQFLVDLCRPTQLSVSPQLRGFYFTGVRAVEVAARPAAAASPRMTPEAGHMEATRIFSPQELASLQSGGAVPAESQVVPQWVFVTRLLREVIGKDSAAEALTGSGLLVHVARRALLTAAMVAFIAVGVGTFVSFRQNARLTSQAEDAVRGVSALPEAVVGVPDAAQLAVLDDLRQVSEQLTGFEVDGPPLSYRWGLYAGRDIRAVTRATYFDRFHRLLLGDARAALVDYLGGVGSAGSESDSRDGAYSALKAYLITAGFADRSTPEFLTPVLMERWRDGRVTDPATAELIRAQFDFYARELALEDPFSFLPYEPVVESARAYVQSFSDQDRYYSALLDEATRQGEDIDFGRLYPEAAQVLRNDVRVPGAFTEEGWAFVQAQLENIDELLSLEDWVIGSPPLAPADRQALASDLGRRFQSEYVDRWAAFVAGAQVSSGGGVAGTARRLETLSARQSPLLQMFALVSQHTSIDSTVAAAFQPVHVVVPPGQTDRLIGDGNQAYVDGLAEVRNALSPVLEASGPADAGALSGVAGSADQAEDAVRQVAQAFLIEGRAGQVGDMVQRLMEAPIESARGLARGLPSQQANAAGSSFCGDFNQLTSKYPFTTSGPEATLDEFVAIFKPGESALWSFYDRSLSGLLERRGNQYAAVPDADPRPTPQLVSFFNNAATLSNSLFSDTGEGPELVLGLRILLSDRLSEVEVNIDGQVHRFTRSAPGIQAFQWTADRARNATVSGILDGETVRLIEPQPGQWALFRLFQIAEWTPQGGGRYTVRWPLTGRNLVLEGEVSTNSSTPILSRSFLSGLRCTSRIVR